MSGHREILSGVDGKLTPAVRLGLKENLGQFSLLVLVNAFVGGMVGLERTVVPLIGSEEFGLVFRTAIFSFIVTFGLVKAFSNLFAGGLADHFGRKKVLVAGWIVGVPVPFMIMLAPSWGWIVAANVLLGVNQGLAWSMTVIMKIDLVGPRGRGLAVGLNEFAGYLAVGLTALATGYLASAYGLRPEPFYLGVGYAVLQRLAYQLILNETNEHETVLQRLEAQGTRSSRSWDAKKGGRADLWHLYAHHQTLAQAAPRNRGGCPKAEPWSPC